MLRHNGRQSSVLCDFTRDVGSNVVKTCKGRLDEANLLCMYNLCPVNGDLDQLSGELRSQIACHEVGVDLMLGRV